MKDRNHVFETLTGIGEWYHGVCRAFRNEYNWKPLDIDDIDIMRIFRIYDEMTEDKAKRDNG